MSGPPDSLAHRHLRIGWLFVLVFAGLGAVLETLHGFKIGAYLDATNETRRHLWTLAHAHGTLFGLVHLGVAATITRGGARRPPSHWGWISKLLLVATVLVPVGFFAGGIDSIEGDPGLGIVLVPVGALLFVVAVAWVVLSLWRTPAEPPSAGRG